MNKISCLLCGNFISIYVINRTLHGRLGIQILCSLAETISHEWVQRTGESYFQHEKIKFIHPRCHAISSIYITLIIMIYNTNNNNNTDNNNYYYYNHNTGCAQMSALVGTAHILRKVLHLWASCRELRLYNTQQELRAGENRTIIIII